MIEPRIKIAPNGLNFKKACHHVRPFRPWSDLPKEAGRKKRMTSSATPPMGRLTAYYDQQESSLLAALTYPRNTISS